MTQRKPNKCLICREPTYAAHRHPSGSCYGCSDDLHDLVKANYKASMVRQESFAEFVADKYEAFSTIAPAVAAEVARKEAVVEKKQLQRVVSDQARELASLALARRSLLHYVERRLPKYQADWLHEDIARRIERFVERIERGESPRLILEVASRAGKELADSTEVLTANRGWTTHGSLKVGDLVFGLNGEPTRVNHVFPPSESDLELTFSNGEKVVAHRRHEWCVYNGPHRTWEVRETQELWRSPRLGTPRQLLGFSSLKTKVGRCLWQVPNLGGPIQQPEAALQMEPYVLGVWLGDGTAKAPAITHAAGETEIIAELVRLGYERTYAAYNFLAGSACTRFAIVDGRSRMRDELRAIGVFDNKHIPTAYLESSVTQRLELLAGLVDTDGTVCRESGKVSITTCSERLKDDCVALLRTLGQRPHITVVQPVMSSSGIQGKKVLYVVGFQPSIDVPTRLPRKRLHRLVQPQKVGIRSIEQVAPQTSRCINVDSPDGMYLVGRAFIPTHNSELASDSGPAWILGHHPDWTVVITSYSDELPVKFSRNIREQLRSDEYRAIFPSGGRLKRDDAGVQAWSTEQGGGVRATGVGGALLGFGANVLIMDDTIKGEQEARNPKTLDGIWEWATSTAFSRLMPNSGVLVIAQRWSVDDLIGRFERKMANDYAEIAQLRRDADEYEAAGDAFEAERMRLEADEVAMSMDVWDIVKYPALAIDDEYLTNDGDIVRVPSTAKAHPGWRLLRKKGESVHPKRFSRAYYLNKKRLNPTLFSAMYQQEPVSEEGSYFNYSDFHRYPPGKHPKLDYAHVFCAWDLAISTATSADYTVGIAGMMDFRGNVYLLERVKGKFGDAFEISDLIIDLHLRWKASITGIEKMMVSQTLGPVLKRRMMERGEFINLAEGKEELKTGNQDKKLRARQIQALCRAGKVFVPQTDSWDEYIAQMTQFGSSSKDDDVDASAWLGVLVTRQPPPRDPAEEYRRKSEEKKDDWYNELIDELRERESSYMES